MPKPTAAGIIFFAGDRVLFTKRDSASTDGGTWDFPGGGIELGETPEEAARRETLEEVGFDYEGPLLEVKQMSNGFCAYAAMLDEPFEPVLNEEHTDWKWATFDDLPEPLHPVTLKELREIDKMPLIKGKSDEARSENIKREIEAGKDPKQAAAIAYSVQRKAGGKDSKRAKDKKAKDSKLAKDTTPAAMRAGHFLQAVDAIHECADGFVAYDRKRK